MRDVDKARQGCMGIVFLMMSGATFWIGLHNGQVIVVVIGAALAWVALAIVAGRLSFPTIVQQEPGKRTEGMTRVQCPFCSGLRKEVCRSCGGSGMRRDLFSARETPCSACGRSGRVACSECKGSGKIELHT